MEMNSFTSLKLRNAWIPPAVAQAPIVTRNLEAHRIPWIRSASCGVVMEPSTSERSYGPLTTAREASGKLAISTASATASSSSSQSSRLSWQPSQEENFQIASLGFRNAMSDLRLAKNGRDAMEGKNRSVLANERWAVLAMTAKADPTFHIAFYGQVRALRHHSPLQKFHHREAHHHFGPANHRHSVGRIEGSTRDHRRHHTDVAAPAAGRAIDRDLNFQVELTAPLFQLVTVQHVFGSARAIKQNDLPILLPFRHQAVERRPQRSQSDSAGHNHNVPSRRFLHGPMASERTANTHRVAVLEPPHGLGDHADHASGVLDQRCVVRVAADRDRHLAYAEDVEHVELARLKGEPPRGIFGMKFQREGVVGLLPYALNAVRHR